MKTKVILLTETLELISIFFTSKVKVLIMKEDGPCDMLLLYLMRTTHRLIYLEHFAWRPEQARGFKERRSTK